MLWSAVLQNTIAVFEEKVFNLCCHHCDEFSIDVSVFVDWLSLSNPNNNLMMRSIHEACLILPLVNKLYADQGREYHLLIDIRQTNQPCS